MSNVSDRADGINSYEVVYLNPDSDGCEFCGHKNDDGNPFLYRYHTDWDSHTNGRDLLFCGKACLMAYFGRKTGS